MIGLLPILDAIASTAMSHHDACKCDVCAATGGDQEALERLLLSIQIQARADAPAATRTEARCTP